MMAINALWLSSKGWTVACSETDPDAAVYWYSNHQGVVPRPIIFNYWWLSLIMIGGLCLVMRQYFLGD